MEGLEEYAKEINHKKKIQTFDGERGSKVEEILKNENDKIAEQKEKVQTKTLKYILF